MKRAAQYCWVRAFDADHTAFAWRVDELIAADHDADVRCARRGRRKEHQVAWLQPIAVDVLADAELIANLPRHRDTVLLVDVADKPAAIEAGWIDAAVSIRRASQRERGARQGVAIRGAAAGDDGIRSARREGGGTAAGTGGLAATGGADGSTGAGIAVDPPPPGIGKGLGV